MPNLIHLWETIVKIKSLFSFSEMIPKGKLGLAALNSD